MDRILATHTGSLIRPPELLAFLAAKDRGQPYDEDAYEKTLKEAVAETVRRQAEAGIDIVNDGEMGKANWIIYLYERVSGLEPRAVPVEGGSVLPPSRDRQAFPGFYAEHDAEFEKAARDSLGAVEDEDAEAAPEGKIWVCTGPIKYDTTLLERDIANLKDALEGVDVTDAFLPVVAPASAYWLENEYYDSEEEFVFGLADALHEEYKAIVDAGLFVQVDDAVLMHEADSIMSLGGSWEDYRKWAELRVDALNRALRGLPEDTRLHPVRQLARSPALSAAAELAGQTALVTGDTAGIGFETARLLAQAGASVFITGRDADRGARAAAALSSFITGFTLHADGGGTAA